MIWETVKDMTATGPIETSLEVAKTGEAKSVRLVHIKNDETYAVHEHADEGRVETILRKAVSRSVHTTCSGVRPRCRR